MNLRKIKIPKLNKRAAIIVGAAVLAIALMLSLTLTLIPPKAHTITLNSDGGTEFEPIVTAGKSIIYLPVPEKDGHRFMGWFYADGAPFGSSDFLKKRLRKDIELKAFWTFTGYVISFETNGGSAVSPAVIDKGGTLPQSPYTSREGYAFLYWCSDINLTVQYNFSTVVDRSFTLYAKWLSISEEKEKHIITFVANGGNTINPIEVADGSVAVLPTPVRALYIFKGWYTDPALTVLYPSGNLVTNDLTLYAKWERDDNVHAVSFVTNGGTPVPDAYLNAGEFLAAPVPERAGYNFLGWYKDINTTWAFNPEIGIYGDLTLYAKWEEIEIPTETYYTTTYVSGSSVLLSRGWQAGKLVPDERSFTKPDYLFEGWYADVNLTVPFDFSAPLSGNVTLYAKWIPAPGREGPFTFGKSADGAYYIIIAFDGGDAAIPSTFYSVPVREIAANAFKNKNVTSLEILSNIERIGDYAFSGTTGLSSVTLPSTIKYIGRNAFENSSIQNIALYYPVDGAGEALFKNSALEEAALLGGWDYLPARAFAGTASLITVNLPVSLKTIGEEAFFGSSVQNIVFAGGRSLETLGEGAFKNAASLSAFDLDGIAAIGAECFRGSGVLSVALPQSLEALGEGAFSDIDLSSADIGVISLSLEGIFRRSAVGSYSAAAENPAYAVLNGDLYSKDFKTLFLYASGKAAASFGVPEGTEGAAPFAFSGAPLEVVDLPSKLLEL